MAPLIDRVLRWPRVIRLIEVLSANLDRAGARLVNLVAEEQRRLMAKPSYHEVVELKDFNPMRGRPTGRCRATGFGAVQQVGRIRRLEALAFRRRVVRLRDRAVGREHGR